MLLEKVISVLALSAALLDGSLDAAMPDKNIDGKIIQAWNWSYVNIIANLETLAEQGFTTIQVSPPNEIKMPTKGVHVCEPAGEGGAPNGWWMFYQPAGFQLNESEDNALGTKAEFVEMCAEAKKYGIKILVDAVINHMGTDDDHIGVYDNKSTNPMDHVNPRAAEFEPELLAAKAFHDPWVNMTYKENYWDGWSDKDIEEDLTQHCTSGLPDLATETQLVQDVIYEYFVELVEAGADGFRFDAVKYIYYGDTPRSVAFWEWYMGELRAIKPDIYCVGECWSGENEILEYYPAMNCFNFAMAQAEGTVASAAKGFSLSKYTRYIASFQQKVREKNPEGMAMSFLSNHDMDRIAGRIHP